MLNITSLGVGQTVHKLDNVAAIIAEGGAFINCIWVAAYAPRPKIERGSRRL